MAAGFRSVNIEALATQGHFQSSRAEGKIANLVNVLSNVALAASKITLGLILQAQSLLADGIHHLGDVLHTAIAYIGFRIAEAPPDKGHPYGHGNAESIAGFLIGLVLLGTGFFVTITSFHTLLNKEYIIQGWLGFGVALISIVFKEFLARYNFHVGKKLNSPVLIAMAQDHRSDAIASLGAVFGIGGSIFGYPILDPIGGIFIGFWIVFISIPVLRQNMDALMDAAPREDLEKRVTKYIEQQVGVVRVDLIRIRSLGPYYEVDLEIAVDGDLSVREGHIIAHRVRDAVIAKEQHVQDVKVHVNPSPEGDAEVMNN